jgi:hypothetical protein
MIKLEVTDSGDLSLDVEGIAIDVMAGLCAGVGVLAEKLANLAFDTREERLAFAEQLAACLQKACHKAIGPKEGEIVSLDSKRRSCRGESQDH